MINVIYKIPVMAVLIIYSHQEIKMATRPNVYANRKKYTRKPKHKNKEL